MTGIKLNEKIVNDIFNDNNFREELISALNELIDIELLKEDSEIDFDLIEAYSEALNELYDEKNIARVFWKLQTVEEFTNSINSNKKWKALRHTFKITAAVCAVLALMITANTITEKVTGNSIVDTVAQAVKEIFTSDEKIPEGDETEPLTTQNSTQDATQKDETTVIKSEEATQAVSAVAVETTRQRITDKTPSEIIREETTGKITPQNPNLSEVLSPETPPTEKETETTARVPFTRVDEDKTAAPAVIRLKGTFSEDFKRNYKVGEQADFSGLTVTAEYDNGEIKVIAVDRCNIYGFSTETPANRIVTVEYEGCSFSYLIRVS